MNIKDSYIHGDLAVVRSIKNFEISGNNLVLKYTNADSNSTEKTYSIPISNFNSALSNKFVTLDTNQTITGLKMFHSNNTGFNTSTREITGNPLIISRGSSDAQALHVGVNDNTAYFIHRQDEAASSFAFVGTWDDTSNDGAGAGYKRIDFVMNQTSSPYISINGNKVYHEGNFPTLYWANVAVSKNSSTTTSPTFNSLTIGTTDAIPHIVFSRSNFNYVVIPTDGTFAVSTNGYIGGVHTRLAVDSESVYPGYTNKTTNLGTSEYAWGNVYASKFIKSGATASNILLADGSDIAQSTFVSNNLSSPVLSNNTASTSATAYGINSIKVTAYGKTSNDLTVDYATHTNEVYWKRIDSTNNKNTVDPYGVLFFLLSKFISGDSKLAGDVNGFPVSNDANIMMSIGRHKDNYHYTQIGFSSNGSIYYRSNNVSSSDASLTGSWKTLYDTSNLTKSVITNLIGTTTYAPYNSNGYLPLDGGTLTGNLIIKKSSSDIGTFVTKTDSNGTTIRSLLFGIGSSGLAGIYDYAKSSWIVSIAKDSPYAATFNGNASTATALTTDAGSSKIPVYFSGGKPVSTGYDLSTFLTKTSAANTYLPLSGGTMTTDAEVIFPGANNKIIWKLSGLTSASYSLINYYGHKDGDSTKELENVFRIGTLTDLNGFLYAYLASGTNISYSAANLRLYNDGSIKIGSNIIYHAGNLTFESPTLSWGSAVTYATVNGTLKKITLPSNPNTDYQVKQSNKTDNVYYPILLGGNYNATASNIATADKTSQVYQNSGVYVNANTKTIYASTFSGSFSGNSTTSTLTKYTLTSSAYHLVGVNENLTSTATARSAIGRNDVLVTASGAIQAVDTAGFNFGTSATIKYNTTNQSIDFIFN